MKYHSTASTIVISISIALMFILVSIFILTSLNMTSPTLMLTNKLFESWEELDSNISIEFTSIERNLRDRVYINGISIKYYDSEIAYFEDIEIKRGLFSLLRYALTGNGVLDIVAEHGKIQIPTIDNGNGGTSSFNIDKSISIELPDQLFAWGVSIVLQDVGIEYGNARLDSSNMSIYFDHGLDDFTLAFDTPVFEYMDNSNEYTINKISLNIDYDNGFGINAAFADGVIKYDSYSAKIGTTIVNTRIESLSQINLARIPIDIKNSGISISSEELSFDARKMAIGYDSKSIEARLDDIKLGYGKYSAGIGSMDISTGNMREYSIVSNQIEASDDSYTILKANRIDSSLDLDKKRASISSGWINSGIISEFTGAYISDISLLSFLATLDFNSDYHLLLESSAIINSSDRFISGTTFSVGFDGIKASSFAGSLRIDEFKVPSIDDTLSLYAEYAENNLKANISFTDAFSMELSVDRNIDFALDIDNLDLIRLKPLISNYVPMLTSYIAEETTMNGKMVANLVKDDDAKYGVVGNILYDIGIDEIRFNNSSFSLSSNLLMDLKDEEVVFDDFAIRSDWVDIFYNGSLNFISNLPEGRFEIISSNGKPYFTLDMEASNLREYTFMAESPYIQDSYATGIVNFATENLIRSDAEIAILGRKNPFDLRIELDKKRLTMDNDNIDIDVDWDNILDISIILDKLPIPTVEQANLTTLDLNLGISFDFAKQDFALDIPRAVLANIYSPVESPTFSFTAHGNNDSVTISNVLLTAEDLNALYGSAFLDLANQRLALSLSDRNDENYLLSISKEEGRYFGVFRGEAMNLKRLGFDGMVGNINLTGKAEKLSDFAFSGELSARAFDAINDDRRIEASLYIDNNQLRLSDFAYSTSSLKLSLDNFEYNATTGKANADTIDAFISLEHSDRPYTISSRMHMDISLNPDVTLFDSLFSLFKAKGAGTDISLVLDYLDADNSLRVENKELKASYDGEKLSVSGSLANGFYNTKSGDMDISVDIDPISVFSLSGNMKEKHSLRIGFDKFAVSLANFYFPSPYLVFYNPAYLYGEINVVIGDDGIDSFGELNCDYSEFDVWWLPHERVILHNATFIIWENDIVSILTDATVLNTETYERIPTKIKLGLYFDSSFGFDSWELDVYIADPYSINFRLPMVASNIDMKGKVSGHYRIYATDNVINNSGELAVDDVVMSLGLDEMPYWWVNTTKTTSDFEVLLRNNIQFIYPLSTNPILSAYIADNTPIGFKLDDNGFSIRGDISLRSGEIYYFQKYFYITEGTIGFRNGLSGLDPIVNLRARLRDFDEKGDSVDIYLVLRDATLDNIAPTFESSPNKDLNEIMSILGQAILPSTAYGDTSLTTAVSLATASVDILSRVGILGPIDNGLSSSIRSSLAIDTFSLHTNILANLVADTVSLATSSSGFNNYSPMARYLDGTSLYIGKYLSQNLYLQAMIHLAADRKNDNKRFSFIADDLIMDTEISLEWSNPLCTVTFFTQPVNLTPYGIVDGFGFSLKKRILF